MRTSRLAGSVREDINQFEDDLQEAALKSFLGWCQQQGVSAIAGVQPLHVAGYREVLRLQGYSVPTVKHHLAHPRARRLAGGRTGTRNQSGQLREKPRYSISKGLTLVLDRQEARRLLDSMDAAHVIGLRDRAVIGLLTYTFARLSTAVGLQVQDY